MPLVRGHGRQSRRRDRRAVRFRRRVHSRGADQLHRRPEGYDYNSHGKAGNAHTDFVPDAIIDRFCLIGPVEEQVARLRQLEALGVDQFAVYLQHDSKDVTLSAYGEKVIPAINARIAAKD